MTTRERLERKLEKRREWSANAAERSTAEFNRSHNLLAPIPMGQPNINGALTGVLKRADSAMRRSCEDMERAEYHAEKARGLERALKTNIYSDDEDAIEKLQEKIARMEELQDAIKIANKVIRDKKIATPEAKAAEIKRLAGDFFGRRDLAEAIAGGGFPSYILQNNNANIHRCQERLKEIVARREHEAAAGASETGVNIEYINGWARVTFAEKPDREILNALKAAGFHWRGGCWRGGADKLPECVKAMAAEDTTKENTKDATKDSAHNTSYDICKKMIDPATLGADQFVGVLIDPEARTVEPVVLPYKTREDGGKSSLYGTKVALDCRLVDCVRESLEDLPSRPGDDIWIDDEGIDNDFGFRLPGWSDDARIGGKGLILGVDLDTGKTVSSTLTDADLDYLRANVVWLNVEK